MTTPHSPAQAPAGADQPTSMPRTWREVAREIAPPTSGYPWLFAALIAATYWLSARATAQPLAFTPDALANVGNVLAPLVLVGAFIERAVEVILTPWRGDGADLMKDRVEAHRQAGNTAAAASESIRLRGHKSGTRGRAFMLAVGLGLLAALLGFRALGNLVQAAPAGPMFVFFDVLITGFVLGGGAAGIHKPVQAFTDYMEMVSDSAKRKAAGQTTP